jgi:exportin-1
MQILENVIRFKWGALPLEQREGVRNFLSNFIIRFTTDEALLRKEQTFVNKLNIILVQILKQDWPGKWPSFIPDIVSASKTSETLCENTMKILRLLSEEVRPHSPPFKSCNLPQTAVCSTVHVHAGV